MFELQITTARKRKGGKKKRCWFKKEHSPNPNTT